MRTRLEPDLEPERYESTDTEITLGMKSLLGVFFGLVLICGVFFGFGYSLGHSNTNPGPATASKSAADASAAKLSVQQEQEPSSSKPDSTDLPQDPQASSTADHDTPARRPTQAEAGTNPPVTHKPSAAVIKPTEQDVAPAPVPSRPPLAAVPSALPVKASPAMTPVSASTVNAGPVTPTMVQVAAVSHQEDANVLVAALKKRGYAVVVRNDPKDSLLHVQIGPFASRDEARAMKSKLLADGYNAILK